MYVDPEFVDLSKIPNRISMALVLVDGCGIINFQVNMPSYIDSQGQGGVENSTSLSPVCTDVSIIF